MKSYSILSRPALLVAALSFLIAQASAQVALAAQPQGQKNARDVDARIELEDALEDAKGRGWTVDAPSIVPLKDTAYPVPATQVLYASPDGDPRVTASTYQSPTTLENALKTAPAGATIILRGGVYRVGGLTLPRRVTLQAARHEQPWIKGSDVITGWQKDGNAWRHDGWKYKFPPRGYNATVLDKIIDKNPLAANSDQVFLQGAALFPVATRPEVAPGKFFVDYKAQQIFIGDDPAGKTTEATAREWGLLITRRGEADPSGSQVLGIGFAHFADAALQASAPDVLIENCSFAWNAISGFNFHPWSTGVKGALPQNCVARGNISQGNGSNGMTAGEADGLLLEGNTFSFNNVRGFKRSWGAAGAKVILSHGFVARHNVIEDNFATGLWMDIDMNGAVVHHNIARRNNGLGIFFEISDGATIAWNVCEGNSTGIQVSNSTRARVFNNTLVNNGRSFYAQWWKRAQNEGASVAGIARGGEYVTRDNVFSNNLVVLSRKQSFVLEAQGGPEKSSARLSQSDNNAYFLSGEGKSTPFARWARDGGEPKSYATLAEFRADEPNYERNNALLEGDPFVDASGGDYRLKPQWAFAGRGAVLAVDARTPLPADVAALGREARE